MTTDDVRWFDSLSAAEQQAALAPWSEPLDGKRLLFPERKGIGAARDIFLQYAQSGQPFSLIRVGDCELGLLTLGASNAYNLLVASGHTPWPVTSAMPSTTIERDMGFAGFDRSANVLRDEAIQAISETDILGLHDTYPPFVDTSIRSFRHLGLPFPHPHGVDVLLPYELLRSGDLFRFLVGKRVILVGHLATRLHALLISRPPRGLGPSPNDIVSVQTPSRERVATRALDDVMSQVLRTSFDVALVSAGLAGKLITQRIRRTNKTALDVGYVFDALLGGGERLLRPVLQEIPWSTT